MVIGTSSTDSSMPSMTSWLAKLQENSKSEAQLQAEMLKGVTETIKDVQEKAAEKAAERAKEADGESQDTASSETAVKSDGIKDPSEITKQDIQSPVDIKL